MTAFGHLDPVGRVRRWLDGTRRPRPGPRRRPLVVGHRGAARHLPENTVPAFRRAIEVGADAVETDLCITRDGAIVLWHDEAPSDPISLARDFGVEDVDWLADWPQLLDGDRKPVREMTLAEMRRACGYTRRTGAVDLVDGDSRPQEPFALLDDLLVWAASEPRLRAVFLDVKLRAEDAPKVRAIVDAVGASGVEIDWHVLLPQRELWTALEGHELPPRVVLIPDFERPGVLDGVEEIGARRVSMGYTKKRTWGDYQKELAAVIEARDDGALEDVTVWTFSDEEKARAMVAARVDAILTDEPAMVRRLVDEVSERGVDHVESQP